MPLRGCADNVKITAFFRQSRSCLLLTLEVYRDKLHSRLIVINRMGRTLMEDFKLFDAEQRLCEIVWEREPMGSTELVRLCEERLGWKKSTTYTVLRKLCARGILQNREAVVTSRIAREQARRYESEALLDRSFDGSLPAFIAAFLSGRRISEREAAEIRRMIEEAEKK